MDSCLADIAAFFEKHESRNWKAAADQYNAVATTTHTASTRFKHKKNGFEADRKAFELCCAPSGAQPPASKEHALRAAQGKRKKYNQPIEQLAERCDNSLALWEEACGRQESEKREGLGGGQNLDEILAQIEAEKNNILVYDAVLSGGGDGSLDGDEGAQENLPNVGELEVERATLQRHQNSIDSEGAVRWKDHARLVRLKRAVQNHMGVGVEVVDHRRDFIEVKILTVVDANARSNPPRVHKYTHTLTVGLAGRLMTPANASLVPQDLHLDDIASIVNGVRNDASGKAIFSVFEQVVKKLSVELERKCAFDSVAQWCPMEEIGTNGTEFRVVLSGDVEAEIEIPRSWPRDPEAQLRAISVQHPNTRAQLDLLLGELNGKDLAGIGLKEFLAGVAQRASQSLGSKGKN